MQLFKNKIFISLSLSFAIYICLKLVLFPPPKNKEQIKSFWIHKTHSISSHNFVVGGDSRIYRGVSISKIEEIYNRNFSGVNLGYSSCGFSNEYINFLTSRLSSSSNQPRFLILGITPVSLTEEFCKNESYHEYKNITYFEQLKNKYLRKLLFNTAPYKPLDFFNSYKELKTSDNYQEEYFDNGWIKSSKLIPDSTSANSSYIKTFNKYSVSQKITEHLFRKLDSIQDTGLNIIAFRPPTTNAIKSIEDSLSGFDEVHIKQLCKLNNIQWLELNPSDYISYDGSHLTYQSAEKLSEQIALLMTKVSNQK